MFNRNHPLFAQHPLNGELSLSVGQVPTPYHVYDGHGTLIGGSAELSTVRHILNNETVHPIQTANRRALMGIWVVDFADASLGQHNELQISIFVSHSPQLPVSNHPLALLKELFVNPAARMFCYRLWNDGATAVAYNRELLGLDAAQAHGSISRDNGQKRFVFRDSAENLILEGHMYEGKRTSPQMGWQLLQLFGLRQTIRAARQTTLPAKVVNPISEAFPFNGDAQTFLASDPPVLQLFDPQRDSLTFGESVANLNFQPTFIEHFAPFRFVYLFPEAVAGEEA
ncbi:hypothetical protein [Candidatus Leptofilum sp.]|uniref:hypothetical protein n=1 Tax=Candidatus Leptofilum sp. TaxID=3241576 RepID=UPI003B5A92D5